MRRGLVGDDVDLHAAPQQLRQHGRAVADQPDRQRAPLGLGALTAGDRVVEVVGHLVEVAVLDAALQARRVDVDDQADAVVQRDGERLRAAHAAAAAGDGERAGERAAEALGGDGGERLVGALQDALGADVDPRAGGHLAVHRQAELLEAAELRPGRPVADEVGVGDQHARRPLVGPHDADRLAGLHEHRLVVAQRRSACGRSRRSWPSRAPPCRCRRRRRGRRGARRPRGRGCSAASAAGPRSARSVRSAWCRAGRGRGGRLPWRALLVATVSAGSAQRAA